jgi:hypothetical protein
MGKKPELHPVTILKAPFLTGRFYDFRIYVDGHFVGNFAPTYGIQSETIYLETGEHIMRIEATRYRQVEQEISFFVDREMTVQVRQKVLSWRLEFYLKTD